MKKSLIKSILLGAIALGMMIGCNEPASTSSSLTPSSTSNSTVSSSSSEITSSSTTSSSNSSSSASSSLPSSSSSSSSSSVAPTLTGIALDTTDVKKAYVQGEALDLTGLVVTASYSDNTSKTVTGYTTDPANGSVLSNIGDITVTVSYEKYTE